MAAEIESSTTPAIAAITGASPAIPIARSSGQAPATSSAAHTAPPVIIAPIAAPASSRDRVGARVIALVMPRSVSIAINTRKGVVKTIRP